MKVKVLRIFRDIYSKELYSVGRELDVEDEARVENLVSRGLVEVVEEKKGVNPVLISLFNTEFEKKVIIDALKSIGEKAAYNMGDKTLIATVAALDEEKTGSLKTALGINQ